MRLVLLVALLFLPAASAVPVEMLFHSGSNAIAGAFLHPDGLREAPPLLYQPDLCPLTGPRSFQGVWTVDPPHLDPGGGVRYGHGDHGFGHSFNITTDGTLTLPFDGVGPAGTMDVTVTLWRGDYRFFWNRELNDAEVVTAVHWTGGAADMRPVGPGPTQVYVLDLSLPLKDLRVDIQDGLMLEVLITPATPCDALIGDIEFHASPGLWPALAFDITDHLDVTSSRIWVDPTGEIRAALDVQHWRGQYGFPHDVRAFLADGTPLATGISWETDQEYHHGVAPAWVEISELPTRAGSYGLAVTVTEADTTVWTGTPLTWTVADGQIAHVCTREKVGHDRDDEWFEHCQSTTGNAHTTPLPFVLLVAALVLAARHRHA